MKRILVLIVSVVLLLSGCGMSSPSKKVEAYLDNYINMSDSVNASLETKANLEPISNDNKLIYKDVLTRQYKNLKYEIKDEVVNGDRATVRVKIDVFDLYKVEKDSLNYANENRDAFLLNGEYNDDMYNQYRLNQMLNTNDTVSYEIEFYLDKRDDNWVVQEPDRITLEKIHGLYNYDVE